MTKTYCDYITKAKALKQEGKISVSYLQRKLKVNSYMAALLYHELTASKKRKEEEA